MAFLDRKFSANVVGAALRNRSWLTSRARLSAIALDGLVWNPEAGCLPPLPRDDRVYVHLVVEGRAHALRGGALEAGQGLVLESARDTFEREPLASVGRHRALALRLDRRYVTGRARGAISLDRARLTTLHAALMDAEDEVAAQAVMVALLALLRGAGLAIDRDAGHALAEIEARDDALARDLSRALTWDGSRPALVDVRSEPVAVSDRQLRRRLGAFFGRYRLPFRGWRELRQSFCLTTAALAMSARGARTDVVGRAAGFASATSFCHALARSGLHTPGEIAARAEALRKNL